MVINTTGEPKAQMGKGSALEIFVDGACIPNPGHMGVGIVLGEEVQTISRYVGWGSNQVAELKALELAIELANSGDKIFSDSHYALNVIQGIWRAHSHIELVRDIRNLLGSRRVRFEWIRGHSGHSLQELADRLAKTAARTRRSRIDSPSDLLSRMGVGGFGHDESEIP